MSSEKEGPFFQGGPEPQPMSLQIKVFGTPKDKTVELEFERPLNRLIMTAEQALYLSAMLCDTANKVDRDLKSKAQ